MRKLVDIIKSMSNKQTTKGNRTMKELITERATETHPKEVSKIKRAIAYACNDAVARKECLGFMLKIISDNELFNTADDWSVQRRGKRWFTSGSHPKGFRVLANSWGGDSEDVYRLQCGANFSYEKRTLQIVNDKTSEVVWEWTGGEMKSRAWS